MQTRKPSKRCEFCRLDIHKKCIPTVQNECQVDKAEKCGRIRLSIELEQIACATSNNCGYNGFDKKLLFFFI